MCNVLPTTFSDVVSVVVPLMYVAPHVLVPQDEPDWGAEDKLHQKPILFASQVRPRVSRLTRVCCCVLISSLFC
jgi:hypothetical protein